MTEKPLVHVLTVAVLALGFWAVMVNALCEFVCASGFGLTLMSCFSRIHGH